jgi:hypothetical protein
MMQEELSGHHGASLSDEQLKRRTIDLLVAAEKVSLQLQLQTEKLAAAIALFDREIIVPLREGLTDDR